MAKGAIQGQEFLTENKANELYLTSNQADSKYATKQELNGKILSYYHTTIQSRGTESVRINNIPFQPVFAIFNLGGRNFSNSDLGSWPVTKWTANFSFYVSSINVKNYVKINLTWGSNYLTIQSDFNAPLWMNVTMFGYK